jgi:hypothetical protein
MHPFLEMWVWIIRRGLTAGAGFLHALGLLRRLAHLTR